ncbi:hypothetical protein PVAP13_7NG025256 [Panicum virgatum]|uniref:Uncharacterized protein n=1 Tax=Panicum virgatum TaxID=38727 RepID=A0A8T0PTE7_PANVG|nr:hypothetical protein PVAP13_7NG025256 [Panicum virgatum]
MRRSLDVLLYCTCTAHRIDPPELNAARWGRARPHERRCRCPAGAAAAGGGEAKFMRPYLPVCLPAISSSGRHLVRLRHGSNGGAWGVASDAVCPEKDVDRWISLLLLLLLRTVIYRHRLVLRSDAGAMFTAERTNGPPPSRIVFSVQV